MTKGILRYLLPIVVMLVPFSLFAASGKISGKIVDAKTGERLPGANVVVEGTYLGTASDAEGKYVIDKVPAGNYVVKVTFIGYKIAKKTVSVTEGAGVTADFSLTPRTLVMEGVYVTANRARERETPVAFTDVKKARIEADLGSRDIPLVLNTTPSVYATQQGGGAGDARVNIRGFNQRNVAIMINGVPVNDMENAWLYWSNWDGVADATSSIQVQRGLSATNLATPSIGGTMNILTDPAAQEFGLRYKQEFGNDGFLKSSVFFNSGLINDKYAVSVGGVRKTGKGLIDATWTDAWAYYFGASYSINANNRLELYALGAPQRHGQNLYKQNIAVYDSAYAAKLKDYDPAAFGKYHEAGRKFNQNWAPVSSSYTGKQNVENKTFNRHDPNFINERENFYHKPQVNLNWYSKLSDKLGLYSILYYSGGRGGGTGTYGSLVRQPFEAGKKWYKSAPWRWDWDATIAENQASDTGSKGILRNSRNNQWTIGAISKATLDVAKGFRLTGGIDWRTAEIEHYREVRDLLGGDYYINRNKDGSQRSDFWTGADTLRRLGDKVDYFFTNTVDWFGFFGQGEYTKDKVTAYGMAGYSTIKYTYTNHFRKTATGKELTAESDRIGGLQVKGGTSYRATENVQFYGNVGWVSKVPIFDNVIDDRTGTKANNPKNEKFVSVEAGTNLRALNGKLSTKLSLYYTTWKDRANSIYIVNEDGSEGIIFLTGMDALHEGIELEAAFQPNRFFRLDGSASIGNWKYTDDVQGVYKDYSTGTVENKTKSYYVKNLKVGDAPQKQFALVGSVFPTTGLQAQVVLRYYRDHYANWDPFSRTNAKYPDQGGDRGVQSWKVPNYSVVDLHINYRLPVNLGRIRPLLFLHIFNLFDATYIQDATDNSQYNAWDKDHNADDAEVFFGLPRFFNLGLSLTL